jgi:hypothetical protein
MVLQCRHEKDDLLPAKITKRRNPRLGILNPLPELFEAHAFLLVHIDPLVPRRHVQSNLFLARRQELGFRNAVRDEEPDGNRKQARRHTLDDEQNPPRRDGASDLRDAVRERSAVGICHRGTADENAVSETYFKLEECLRHHLGFCHLVLYAPTLSRG